MRRWSLALLGCAGLAGCAGLPGAPQNPDIQLSRVVVRGADLSGGTLDLIVRVANPNNFQLRGTRIETGFDVEDTHVGDVTFDDAYTIPGDGSTSLTLPLRFAWAGVGAAFRSVLASGDLPYTMKGQATLTAAGIRFTVPFTRSGRAPLSRLGVSAGVGARHAAPTNTP